MTSKVRTWVFCVPFLACGIATLPGCGLENFDKYGLPDTGAPEGNDGAGDGGGSGGPDDSDTGLPPGDDAGGDVGGGGSGGAGSGGSGGSGGAGSGGDDSVDPITLAIDAVSPDYGITAGGDTVTISGGPFDSSAVVTFGGAEATVVSASETSLVVRTPSVASEGLAAVSVDTDAGSGRRSSAFRYWADGRGQFGALGAVELIRYTGGYWSGGTPADERGAIVYFTDPSTYRWYELYAPTLDTCRNESWTSAVSVSIINPGVTSMTFRPSSGSNLVLTYDAGAYTTTPSSLTAGAYYDLVAPGGSLPAQDVNTVFRLPSAGPTVSSPLLASSTLTGINTYPTFRWTPGGADWVLLTMALNNGLTADGYELVTCPVVDDGSFVFDTSQFSFWASGVVAVVSASFVYDQPGTVLPWNQSTSAIAGMVTTVGGVYTN